MSDYKGISQIQNSISAAGICTFVAVKSWKYSRPVRTGTSWMPARQNTAHPPSIHPSIHPSTDCNSFIIPFLGGCGFLFFFAGSNPSCLWVKAGCSSDESPAHRGALHWWQRPKCKVLTAHLERFRVQYLLQGHFDMQPSSAQSWDLNQRPSDH